MSEKPHILEIAVPSPLFRRFDYRAPKDADIQPGMRVVVPFGSRKVVGIVLAVRDHTEVPDARLKSAAFLPDAGPVLDAELMQLLNWAARYYHHPIGETLATALPVLLRKPEAAPEPNRQRWRLTEAGHQQTSGAPVRAVRQAQVLTELASYPQGLPRQALPAPKSVLDTLEKKGWIEVFETAPDFNPKPHALCAEPHPLNAAQQHAVEQICASANHFEAFLLEGVTGSGKTEVYLQVITPLLEARRQILVLVPEIGLTPQLVERFSTRFAADIAVLHSGLNDRERLDAWRAAASGQAGIIIGTRSAIFTPLARPGLIIVDEEHDASLKQQDGFRYSARDLAVWRARQLNVPVVLGTATPSLESLFNVQQQRYQRLHLPERAGSAATPPLKILDLRGQPMRSLLSASLRDAMRQHLQRDGQVLLFLNRRGFAPVLLCHDCGWMAECRRCDARLTLHHHSGELRCHHCGSQRRAETSCPSCNKENLLAVGEGTERIEQALRDYFPDETVLRIDRDTTRRKGSLETALADAQSGKARILLGTQMLAKGHHFPNVTLASILDADQGLFSADFRASERMAQLIVQVAGRAGRADKPGEVVIQTHYPEHPLLHQLISGGYTAFADAALRERQEALLPPFASLALLRAEATRADYPREFLNRAHELAAPVCDNKVQLWGPVAAPMERRAGRYRAQLLLQAEKRADLQHLLKHLIPLLEGEKISRKVRWSIDVDPVDMY
ncbi:Helicase PriA essential for oriC/DnaA-independent DNA replication [hydrothermal vent metagenome]|uniref:DNA 3'-5' helicase n=1 Tax=hydrothermal vent metagenome TaxID=652676 RepID=A0A3B0Z153_9ZZZZ